MGQTHDDEFHKLANGPFGGEAIEEIVKEDVLIKGYLRFGVKT